jgi:hypothetical protein
MGRVYSAIFEGVSVSGAQDFFTILAADRKSVAIHEIVIADHDSDADEKLRVRVVAGASATTGSGGSAATPRPLNPTEAAAGASVTTNNTTKMTAGSGAITTIKADAFNTASGWFWVPTPECRPVVGGGNRITVELVSAPAAARAMTGCVIFEEIS